MKQTVRAKIEWHRKNKDGQPWLLGRLYSTAARFESRKDEWPEVAWSLVVIFDEPFEDSLTTIAEVGFLVEDAPQELLQPGSSFELLEGEDLSARGTVLGYSNTTSMEKTS